MIEALEPSPLQFGSSPPREYLPPPVVTQGTLRTPGPFESLRQELLDSKLDAKTFLSGHIGSGKSTELSRLVHDEKIQQAFEVVELTLESDVVPHLDTPQILFLLAYRLYDLASQRSVLPENGPIATKLREVESAVYAPSGIAAKEGSVGTEVDLIFVKLRTDLKLSQERRRSFREFAETQQTVLQDLLKLITTEIQKGLVSKSSGKSLLVVIDDLDKVRDPEKQKDIFDTNLEALLAPPFRILYTVPSGVVFGPQRKEIRDKLQHIYPRGVLARSPTAGFDPRAAFVPGSARYFHNVLARRAEPELFQENAVDLAALYSGGVLREFFRLLRGAARLAVYNDLAIVDANVMTAALHAERLNESRGLLAGDYEALRNVHATHHLDRADHRYLDEARVLECFNEKVWYEVNPLLWAAIDPDEHG